MGDEKKKQVAPTEQKKKIRDVKFTPTEDNMEFIRQLQKDHSVQLPRVQKDAR